MTPPMPALPVISWDEMFLKLAEQMSQRSKDPSTKCGAVLISATRVVLSAGFNGPPPQMMDELIPWGTRPEKYAYIIHAEENAMWYAAESHGFERLKGSSLYVTHEPCAECTLRAIRLNLKEIVVREETPPYPLSKYQVEPAAIIERQASPKLNIRRVARGT